MSRKVSKWSINKTRNRYIEIRHCPGYLFHIDIALYKFNRNLYTGNGMFSLHCTKCKEKAPDYIIFQLDLLDPNEKLLG